MPFLWSTIVAAFSSASGRSSLAIRPRRWGDRVTARVVTLRHGQIVRRGHIEIKWRSRGLPARCGHTKEWEVCPCHTSMRYCCPGMLFFAWGSFWLPSCWVARGRIKDIGGLAIARRRQKPKGFGREQSSIVHRTFGCVTFRAASPRLDSVTLNLLAGWRAALTLPSVTCGIARP